MRSQFLLFQSHLDFAHALWQKAVLPGSVVVDATCGNGHDTLLLGKLALTPDEGALYGFDVQNSAIDATSKLLMQELGPKLFSRTTLLMRCHTEIAEALCGVKANLIVYNLGYLPGADKTITTKQGTSLTSVQQALGCLADKGVISITCYPGHEEGRLEEETLVTFCQTLDPKVWSVSSHRWLNRRAHPHLLLIQRA